MNQLHQEVLNRLFEQPPSPALRQIRALSQDAAEVGSPTPSQPAHEVLSVWSIRLWNATLRAKRFVGLADLVRTLLKLSPETMIGQISLTGSSKTGLIFFNAETRQPLGAVIAAPGNSDSRRSERNFAEAKGMPLPVLSVRPSGQSKQRAY